MVFALCSLLLAPCSSAHAQHAHIPRIGYLAGGGSSLPQAFVQTLRDLGYAEGKNIAFEYRTTEGQSRRYPDLAAELVRLNVDIIVAEGLEGEPVRQESYQHNPYCHDF